MFSHAFVYFNNLDLPQLRKHASVHTHTHTPQPPNPVDAAESGRHLHNTTKLISLSPAVLESREDENIRRRCPEHGIIIEDLRSLLVSN